MKAIVIALFAALSATAGVLPVTQVDAATLKAFDDYIATFEKGDPARFAASGQLWIDSKLAEINKGEAVVEGRYNKDAAKGSIHHFSGSIRVNKANIANFRKMMLDFPAYPKFYRGDVVSGRGDRLPDSTPDDEHYATAMALTQSAFHIDVAYDSAYDVHYRRPAEGRWTVRSASTMLRERKNPKDPAAGFYPEGNDHGFLWRTNTYWQVRERDGGLDLQVDSISLSRSAPLGLGWLGRRQARDTVEKILRDTRAAIEAQSR